MRTTDIIRHHCTSIKDKFLRLCQLYNNGGISEVKRGIFDYMNASTSERTYNETRTDNQERWDLIQPYLPESGKIVDVGCAEGWFTAKAAEQGLNSVGIDSNYTRVERARNSWSDQNNCEFILMDINPNTVSEVPETDVLLVLTVHHHWVREFGAEAADEILRILATKCDILIYEPPGHLLLPDLTERRDKIEDSTDYYSDYIESVLDTESKILDVNMVEYVRSSKRKDPLFVINTKG